MAEHAGLGGTSYAAGSLLCVDDLSVPEVARILRMTTRLDGMSRAERAAMLDGRTVALLFYESSTRTRTSFELAAKSLGATTTLVSDKSSSIEKGESLKDTGLTLRALGAECIILRHNASGAPNLLARTSGLPVLNAGDGMHQHPSQALLDLRTILTRLGTREEAAGEVHAKTLAGVTVVIAGDILHSRVARSNAMLLPRLGARVVLCGPEALLPQEALGLSPAHGAAIEIERDFERALAQADVVMMLRIQKERVQANTGIDMSEYTARYQLNKERAARYALKLVMHPGPMNRGLEIDDVMADGPLSTIEEQVAHGLAVRRALLVRALGGIGVSAEMLILGGRVVDPASGLDEARDLLVRDGRIAALEQPGGFGELGSRIPEELQIDAAGLVVAPGFVDVHVHLREPGQTHKETIATGTAAAAMGGFTTVVAMPNTTPVNDSAARLEWMTDAARGAVVNLLAMPAATFGSMGHEITDFHALVRAGAVGFTDDGKPVLEDAVMRAALVAAADAGVPVSQHAEDTRMTGGCSMNAGRMAFRLGLRGMPVEAESSIVERDIRLLREIEQMEGCRPHLHVQHVSTAKALAAIRAAKHDGLHVTCEAAPHHFALTEDAIGDYNTNAKMNPPLRAEADRRAVIAGLQDGTVDCIATDHAPHASWEKQVEFERAPNGITGLETALALALRVLHREHGISLKRVVELMSARPAEIVGLRDRGTLRVGSVADLVIFDPAATWKYEAAASPSKSHNTPFDGEPMVGRVTLTMCGGKVVYRG